jgi:hypothetical protein
MPGKLSDIVLKQKRWLIFAGAFALSFSHKLLHVAIAA